MGWNSEQNSKARLFNTGGVAVAILIIVFCVDLIRKTSSGEVTGELTLFIIAAAAVAFIGIRASTISQNFRHWGRLSTEEKLLACIPIGVGVMVLFWILLFVNVAKDEFKNT